MRRRNHPPCDGVSVQKMRIASFGFESMSDGMSKIEHLTQAALAFVGAHNPRLKTHRLCNHFLNHDGIAIQNFTPTFFKNLEQSSIADDSALERFVQARAILTRRKSGEHIGIDEYCSRLMKCPEQILAGSQVDAGLSADR